MPSLLVARSQLWPPRISAAMTCRGPQIAALDMAFRAWSPMFLLDFFCHFVGAPVSRIFFDFVGTQTKNFRERFLSRSRHRHRSEQNRGRRPAPRHARPVCHTPRRKGVVLEGSPSFGPPQVRRVMCCRRCTDRVSGLVCSSLLPPHRESWMRGM